MDKNFQESITLKAGQSTAFEIPFKGNPQPKVIWTFNDGELPKDKRLETQTIHNMTTMRLAKAKRPDAGNYKLTLENPRGKTSVDIKMIVLGINKVFNLNTVTQMHMDYNNMLNEYINDIYRKILVDITVQLHLIFYFKFVYSLLFKYHYKWN